MIKSLHISNFTAFSNAGLEKSGLLNIIIGENGTGKSHLLKLIYTILNCSAQASYEPAEKQPTKDYLSDALADKLVTVFRPDMLGNLVNHDGKACDISIQFDKSDYNMAFNFSSRSKKSVNIEKLPEAWMKHPSIFFPPRELITLYPEFISLYQNRHLSFFEEIYLDTCLLLGDPLLKNGDQNNSILTDLGNMLGGTLKQDKNGRFYLITAKDKTEMMLVADGLRKIAMLYQLIANGTLQGKSYLFWDEPETSLNPRLIKQIAKIIIDLSCAGIQIFIATHSLFLLRELEMLAKKDVSNTRFITLSKSQHDQSVQIKQATRFEELEGDLVLLDEELLQSDRFMGWE